MQNAKIIFFVAFIQIPTTFVVGILFYYFYGELFRRSANARKRSSAERSERHER